MRVMQICRYLNQSKMEAIEKKLARARELLTWKDQKGFMMMGVAFEFPSRGGVRKAL